MKLILLLTIVVLSAAPIQAAFKQQFPAHDPWYYTDGTFDLTAPDKFQHMAGSHAGAELLSLWTSDMLAAGAVFSLGIVKEVCDGFGHGWSWRDLCANGIGVVASVVNTKKIMLWCDWNRDAVILKIGVAL